MLYYGLSLLTGALIALMVAVNGALSAAMGAYRAAVVIHVVGLVFVSAVCLVRRSGFFAGGPRGTCTWAGSSAW